MQFYRLCKATYHNDLDGVGASLGGGRWNSTNQFMVYASEQRSLCLMESLAHLNSVKRLAPYSMMVLYAPDTISIENFPLQPLDADWRTNQDVTQRAGDEWLRSGRSLLLRVPSVIVPQEFNLLMNPRHPDRNLVRILEIEPFHFDPRLK